MKTEITPLQAVARLKALDNRLGVGKGAVRERRRLRTIIAKNSPSASNLNAVLALLEGTER